ncbi:hypothetical protein NKH37_28855 [Mesorhizobium sp. M1217]|uniref:hypothetical protein n=1 Tax=Mesorhizobium sp. M1217 TaxID=2957070 RepID=UPI0033376391
MADDPKRYVYWLQMVNGFGPTSRSFAVVFECEHPTIADIERELRHNGVVAGSKLDTIDDGKGGRLIRRRDGFMVGVAGLCTIQTYHKPCWEPDEWPL